MIGVELNRPFYRQASLNSHSVVIVWGLDGMDGIVSQFWVTATH